MHIIICSTNTFASIVLLLLFRVDYSVQLLCADLVNFVDQENTQQIVSVRCLGNGSASVSYNLSDSGYTCPAMSRGDRVKIQVDYVCYSKNSHSSCTNQTVIELNDGCSNKVTHSIMDGCNCSFESCMERQQYGGAVKMLPSSGKSCAADGDPTEPTPVLSSSTVAESIMTTSVLALTSDVSKTVVLSATFSLTDSPSLSSTSPNEPSNVVEWVAASSVAFIVLLATLVVVLIAAFTLRSVADKREDGSEWLHSKHQMAFMGRDPSTGSIRTVLDLLSLPNEAQVSSTQSVSVDVHDDYGTQKYMPPEPTFKLITDLPFSDDDSATYIHLGVPVPLSPTTANGPTDDSILQQTHFPCPNEEPLSDCTVSITSDLDDPPPSSGGYEGAHKGHVFVLSDGYTTASAMTTRLPTAGGFDYNSAGMVQVHKILDLRPEVVQRSGQTDPCDPVESVNGTTAAVLTGDSEAGENTETHTPSPFLAPSNIQERTS